MTERERFEAWWEEDGRKYGSGPVKEAGAWRAWQAAAEGHKSGSVPAALALLAEWIDTEMDPEDDEYAPWMENFTARVRAALEGHKPGGGYVAQGGECDRFYAAAEALLQLGRESAVAITGNVEDSADVDTMEKAIAAIREEIRLGREAAAELAETERHPDTARLDFLECEARTEKHHSAYVGVFRRNMPITREAIDQAMAWVEDRPPHRAGAETYDEHRQNAIDDASRYEEAMDHALTNAFGLLRRVRDRVDAVQFFEADAAMKLLEEVMAARRMPHEECCGQGCAECQPPHREGGSE